MKTFNMVLIGLIVILINVLFTLNFTNAFLKKDRISEVCDINKYNYAGENKFKWVISFSFDEKEEALNFIYRIYGTDK